MKKFNLFIFVILFQWMGSVYKAQASQNDITRHEEDNLFEIFMDICWETWCSEEFDILISNFFCSFKRKQCSFTVDFFQYKTKDGIIKDSFESDCSMTVQSKEELFPKTFIMPDHIIQQVEKCVYKAYPKALRYYKVKYGT